MGTMQWLDHFENSVRRDRDIDWGLGVSLSEDVRDPVLSSLQTFQRGLTSPGINLRTKIRQSCDREYADCMDYYVQEKAIHSELLMRLLWEADSGPAKRALVDFAFRRVRRRFDWARELMILLSAEIASMPFFRMLVNRTEDPLLRQVLETIMEDQAYHLGFHIDHLRPEILDRSGSDRWMLQQAWSSFFSSVLTVLIYDNRDTFAALGESKMAFWTDAWNLFAQVQSGLHGSDHMSSILGRDPRLKFAL